MNKANELLFVCLYLVGCCRPWHPEARKLTLHLSWWAREGQWYSSGPEAQVDCLQTQWLISWNTEVGTQETWWYVQRKLPSSKKINNIILVDTVQRIIMWFFHCLPKRINLLTLHLFVTEYLTYSLPFEWLQATITLVPFRVKFSSMSEFTQTLQADLCDVKRCSCVVFSLKAWRKDLTNRPKVLSKWYSTNVIVARSHSFIIIDLFGYHIYQSIDLFVCPFICLLTHPFCLILRFNLLTIWVLLTWQ